MNKGWMPVLAIVAIFIILAFGLLYPPVLSPGGEITLPPEKENSVEYRPGKSKEWFALFKDEEPRINDCLVYIRRTEFGKDSELFVTGLVAFPRFSGDIKAENNEIRAEGKGGLVIKLDQVTYGYIVLKCQEQ